MKGVCVEGRVLRAFCKTGHGPKNCNTRENGMAKRRSRGLVSPLFVAVKNEREAMGQGRKGDPRGVRGGGS